MCENDSPMMRNIDDKLESVYRTDGSREALDGAYDEWARDYDQDLWASGTPYFAILAAMVARYVDNMSARILDCGCGTGLVGELLATIGFTDISGLDAYDGMIEAATAKGCYGEIHQLLLDETIDLPPESFDALTAGGVLTLGHAPPASLDGMLALTKPGGLILFSMSQAGYEQYGFGTRIDALQKSGAWTLIDETAPFQTFPYSEEHADVRHWVSVFRKTG